MQYSCNLGESCPILEEPLSACIQGYTIQSATLDFTVNATVTSGGAAGATAAEVVSLGPSTPVGRSMQVRCSAAFSVFRFLISQDQSTNADIDALNIKGVVI